VLFLVVTANSAGRPSESSSDGTALIGVISTLGRFPAVLRLFVMAAISAREEKDR
jgi:hypothetical protein